MTNDNVVAVKFTPEEKQQILAAIQTLQEFLGQRLIALTPDQRQDIPKMSDKTLPFVEKVMAYARSDAQFVPVYMQVDELQIDLEAVRDLTTFLRPLEQLWDGLIDTITLSGSEAYMAALTYYQSVKHATRMNVAGAKTVYDDLSARFPGGKSNRKSADTRPAA